MFTRIPEMAMYPKAALTCDFIVDDQKSYFVYRTNVSMVTAMFVMEVSGQVKTAAWAESVQDWVTFLAMPKGTVQCVLCLWCFRHVH